jgi:hypothetical protein
MQPPRGRWPVIKNLALDGFLGILAREPASRMLEARAKPPQRAPAINRRTIFVRNLKARSKRMENDRYKTLREELAQLLQQHRVFDETIATLEMSPERDQLQISRLKRQKLNLKDRITQIEDQLLPDIIA